MLRPRSLPPVSAGLVAVLVLVLVGIAVLPPVSSAQSLDEARDERRTLQSRLDSAAERLAAVEDRVAAAESRTVELELEAASLDAGVTEVRSGVEDQVVALFKHGSIRDPLTVLLTSDDPQEAQLRAQVLQHTIAGDVGELEALGADLRRLAAVEGRLAQERSALDRAVAEQAEVATSLEADLSRAAALERRLEEEDRERREAEARERRERERREREAQTRAAAQAERERSRVSASADDGIDGIDGRADDAAPPAPAAPTTSSGMACPVAQPRSFTDTWGAPRSGGRAHRGTDILAPMGTPVVAIVDGNWSIRSPGPSAGLWAILRGRDGNQYWYMHLESHSVSDGASVSAGQQVGTNGDTGNARGTPHVHFELHPGGVSAVNPYPTLSRIC